MSDKLPNFDELEELPDFGDLEDLPAAEASLAAPESDISQAESAIGGIKSGGTLGFRGEVAGLAGAAGYGVGKLGMGELPSMEELLNTYREARGEEDLKAAKESDANPGSYMAGEIAGGFAIPGVGAAKGVGNAMKVGAGMGAVAGLGTSEADLTKGEFGEAAQDVAIGTGFGGAFGAAGHGLGKLLKPSDDLRKSGEKAIFSSLKPPKSFKRKELLSGTDKISLRGIGKALSEDFVDSEGNKQRIYKIDTPVDELVQNIHAATNQHIVNNVNPLMDEVQNRISQKLTKVIKFQNDPDNSLINQIRKLAEERKEVLIKTGEKAKVESLESFVENLIEPNVNTFSGLDMKDLQTFKRYMGSRLSDNDWQKAVGSKDELSAHVKDFQKDVYYLAKKRIEDVASTVSDSGDDLGKRVKEVNMKTANLLDANKMASEDLLRMKDAKFPISKSELLLPTMIGAGFSNPALAFGVAAGEIAVRTITGKDIGTVAQLSAGRGFLKLAEVVEKMGGEKAAPLMKQIGAIKNLGIPKRAEAIRQIIMNNPDVFEAEKVVEETKKENIRHRNAEENLSVINSEPDQIEGLVAKLGDTENESYKKYVGPLQKASEADPSRRKAILWGLTQQVAFREMLKSIKDNEIGES
jgi:hypothetical protein